MGRPDSGIKVNLDRSLTEGIVDSRVKEPIFDDLGFLFREVLERTERPFILILRN